MYEVKSGMLIMPKPSSLAKNLWEIPEAKEKEEVVKLYGKTYHLWQVYSGDKVSLGTPQLMTAFTDDSQLAKVEGILRERDEATWSRL